MQAAQMPEQTESFDMKTLLSGLFEESDQKD
jgi:hypothetical protein